MFCQNCGNQVIDGARFCAKCGQPIAQAAEAASGEVAPVEAAAVAPASVEAASVAQTAPVEQTVAQQPAQDQQAVPAQTAPAAQTTQAQPSAPLKKENIFTGTIGAILGAALGAGVIILLSRLGIVASFAGLVLAFCTFMGYGKLGHRIGVMGIIICTLLIFATPYVADRIDWAIVIVNSDMGISFGEAFSRFHEFVEYGFIDQATYIKNLVMVYLFTGLGAVGMIASAIKSRRSA